ncbi:MAG: nicotinate (nicotinamide) nucleotide adenylyltransferase [Aquincola tertiaricarbonis]|uniref:nicotinate (nicotinamide) nucleotide adenylyltransferase n=1 Tax=Aquincola sp. J276 TaxID=2898432 RepID=UPI0021512F3F|nr:nicotinate (nicotinamide) nucleotide adenylyltransferase [Aquincola sp. J276]MCR5865363.1 nicotinate (nicotinamide) nucleotide adenylyltransferase [Aquincola sp. J276]
MSRIGIFGGSFDPVHNTHLALAAAALQHLRLDELRWVPTGHPWHKASKPADAAHRVAMLKLALAGEPRYTIDELELHRSGPSYTIDTVRWLQASQPELPGQHNEWFLVIGQDQYEKFNTWHGWRELLDRLTLAVANRAGAAPQAPPALQAVPHRVEVVPLPPSDMAATDIRSRLAQGLPIDMLVPPQVARYIAQNALYRK